MPAPPMREVGRDVGTHVPSWRRRTLLGTQAESQPCQGLRPEDVRCELARAKGQCPPGRDGGMGR